MGEHKNWCRHRTPFDDSHPVCKVGIDYHAQFLRDADGKIVPIFDGAPGRVMPCLGMVPDRCPSFSAWTEEENAARDAEIARRLERIGIVRAAIVAVHEETGRRSGRMGCPSCEIGTVSWSMASNGHVHAGCSSEGCVRWME